MMKCPTCGAQGDWQHSVGGWSGCLDPWHQPGVKPGVIGPSGPTGPVGVVGTNGAGLRSLVAGGAGFIGSHLVDELLAMGHDVTIVDNFSTGRAANIAHLRPGHDIAVYSLDVADSESLKQLEILKLAPHDFVWNLASPASPPAYQARPRETLRTGAEGTYNLLELAKRWDAGFLLASTSEVYGDPLEHPQTEFYLGNVDCYGPRSMYDEAKRYAEAMTRTYRKDVNVHVARIFNTMGPRMDLDDGRVVPAFIKAALSGYPLPIHGDGTQTRSLCYVDDLVDGLIRLMSRFWEQPVNLGNDYEVTINYLASRVCELAGVPLNLAAAPRPQGDPERRRPSLTTAKHVLNWTPTTDLDTGLSKTIAWADEELEDNLARRT